ncbi:hypothetical protein AVEN_198691-1 [Araneus ventricosus]|uniref:Uncharacterized protein n=1 Tax=Araneus ventricosus TaxID=182803 RepID=A0A4Y2HEF9_ARAVE|nr:hypothetical protein AVEN_198691-1 [Araneus ventricosus]
MMRTTPQLAPPLQTSAPHQRKDVWPLRMIQRATGPIHGGSSVESCFEAATLRSRGRDLNTRPPRPRKFERKYIPSIHFRTSNSSACILQSESFIFILLILLLLFIFHADIQSQNISTDENG